MFDYLFPLSTASDVNLGYYNIKPLECAIKKGNVEIIEKLISKGANLKAVLDFYGNYTVTDYNGQKIIGININGKLFENTTYLNYAIDRTIVKQH